MKWLTIIMMVLVLPIVMADKGDIEIFKPREVFDLSVHASNRSGNVLEANCSVQIRNESYGLLVDDVMNEIGGGWYNYTYNQSRVGIYFCRQNCTQGMLHVANTCDFAIQGDENMPIAIVLVVIFVMIVYFIVLINMFTTRSFTEHGLFKLLFMMIAFWAILLPINIAVQFNDDNGGPIAVTSNLELLYQIVIWLNVLITFYWFLWFIVQLLKKLGKAKREGRLGL